MGEIQWKVKDVATRYHPWMETGDLNPRGGYYRYPDTFYPGAALMILKQEMLEMMETEMMTLRDSIKALRAVSVPGPERD
jgi:hypothetical protein